MKRSFFALLMMFALVLSAVSFSFAETKTKKSATRQTNQLASQLPNSDAVVIMDMQRLMRDALPQLFSGRMQFLNEINTQIDDVKNQIGIDLRQFEQLAVGFTFKQTPTQKIVFEPIVLARGRLNAISILETSKSAAKGKFREEKNGASTIYIFSLKEILQNNKPKAKTPQDEEKFNKMLGRVPSELAVIAVDNNTLAIGSPVRVREMIGGKSRVSPDILSLVNRNANSMMSFGGNVPAGLSKILKLDIDQLGRNLDSIRQVFGGMNVAGGNTLVSIAAKTFKPEQATELEESLSGLQMIGRGFLGGMKGADKQVYARMVESAKITRAADEVTINLQVSNSDLSILLGQR